MTSPDLTQANIDKIAQLFPNVITESSDADGNPERAVDFDLLRQEFSDHIVEGPQERYRLDWPGKRAAAFAANAPITKTLRPVREESVDFDTTKNLFINSVLLRCLSYILINITTKTLKFSSWSDWCIVNCRGLQFTTTRATDFKRTT